MLLDTEVNIAKPLYTLDWPHAEKFPTPLRDHPLLRGFDSQS
jgi:hypothetical protein